MARKLGAQYLGIGVGVLAFVALAVWLIRSEGQRTREALRDATQDAAKEVREGLVEGAERAVEKAAEVPGQVIRDVKDEVSDEVIDTAERAVDKAAELPGKVLGGVVDAISDKPDNSEPETDQNPQTPPQQESPAQTPSDIPIEPPAEPATGEAPAGPTSADASVQVTPSTELPPSVPSAASDPAVEKTTPTPETVAKDAGREDSATRGDVVEEVFRLGHRVTESLDDVGQEILGLTAQQEMDLGRDVHEFVRGDQKVLRSPAVLRRLQNLARPMLLDRGRKDIKYNISILDNSAINAFAHVGGYLYVTKGLIEFARNDAELQFVLGHEIGHVDLKHCSKQASYVVKARDLAGDAGAQLATIAYQAIALGYSEEQEFEADEYGFRAFTKAGQEGQVAVAFLERVKTHLDAGNERHAVEGDDTVPKTVRQIQDHFRTHPPTAERILRLERLSTRAEK